MNKPGAPRRPRRTPYSQQEVAALIELKRRQEHIKLLHFKNTFWYKYQNIFNSICFVIYWEIIFCFFGVSNFQVHQIHKVNPKFGDVTDQFGNYILNELTIKNEIGNEYKFTINQFMEVPKIYSKFYLGKDFILQKTLKGKFEKSDNEYRVFLASPILFLCVMILIISFIAIVSNLNHQAYSLAALSILNVLALFAIVMI
jgi:hypothetical protein